ncbi:MAG: hypothetical protein R3E32_14205 [Chitinophagales bacterium]
MLSDCKIQKVQEIKTVLRKNNIVDVLTKAYQPFQLNSLLSEFAPIKKQGYSLTMLFLTLLVMPYLNASTVHSLYKNAFDYVVGCAKDSLYRFKNNEWIPWRTILYRFNKRYDELVLKNGESIKSAKPKCLIAFAFDDLRYSI